MNHKLVIVCLGLIVAGSATLYGEEGIKHPVAVSKTEQFTFGPGGTIRMNAGYGQLNVEGWDKRFVEITVTKSMGPDYRPEQEERAKQRLDRVRVVTEHRSETELIISTDTPARGGHLPLLSGRKTGGVLLDYDIHAPRDARLVIHHGKGYVAVSDMSGDIEATMRSGDILVMLPRPGTYSIDAKCRIGKVVSDFLGMAHRKYLLGERFDRSEHPGSRRVYLRVGFGGITIQASSP